MLICMNNASISNINGQRALPNVTFSCHISITIYNSLTKIKLKKNPKPINVNLRTLQMGIKDLLRFTNIVDENRRVGLQCR